MGKKLNKIDKDNLRQVIINIADQFNEALSKVEKNKIPDFGTKFDSLVVCGMGGSIHPGYLLQSVLKTKFPILLHTNYGKPLQLSKNPLFFVCSYSGNTEETLDCYESVKNEYKLVSFANGGELIKRSKKDRVPLFEFQITDPAFQPRYALPTTFTYMVWAAINSGLLKNVSLNKLIKSCADFLDRETGLKIEDQGKEIAERIGGKTIIFYAPYSLRYSAMICKIKTNENSKRSSFWNFFPELNHNEISGFLTGDPEKFAVVSFEDEDPESHPRNALRSQVTRQILTKNGYDVINISVKGNNLLERFFYITNYGDWISYYLAILNKQDPTAIIMQEEFKKKL